MRQALDSRGHHFLNLHAVFVTSDTTRISCIKALGQLYRRLATGRPLPPEMPIPESTRNSSLLQRTESPGPVRVLPPQPEFDSQTAVWSTASELPVFKSEPPSPPPTPKLVSDDIETSSCFSPSKSGPSGTRQPLRPKNSVFSIFCPEAMALQVDPGRQLPGLRSKCKCGYKWNVPELSDTSGYMALKDGFRITRRFLAKSHCDQSADKGISIGSSADQTPSRYGCVLCTSTGRTERFETALMLRAHINATHDKWQMLHDRDMA